MLFNATKVFLVPVFESLSKKRKNVGLQEKTSWALKAALNIPRELVSFPRLLLFMRLVSGKKFTPASRSIFFDQSASR